MNSIDKTGLQDRTFEAFSVTGKSSYIFLCNMNTNVSRWSRNAVEYFNLPGEYMYDAGSIWEEYIHPDDLATYRHKFDDVYNCRTKWQDFEYRARNRFGNYVVCTCQCTVLKGENGEPDLFSGTIINHGIVDSIDPVTNLYSDFAFLQKLQQLETEKIRASVVLIGINMFSRINVMYGYEYGNEIMRLFGEELKRLIKGQGIAYKLDGAKFAICLYGKDKDDTEKLYEKIQELAQTKIRLKELAVPLKVSGGAVLLDKYGVSVESIKSGLAYALNRSKHERHGKLVFFIDSVHTGDGKNLEVIGEIHRRIMNGCRGFYMCYQPIVSVDDGKIIGMEALVRWKMEPYGEVSPNLFIPWMEEDPGFFELGKWIMRQSLADGMRIKRNVPDFILNINISLAQFEKPEFRDSVIKLLDESGFPPEDLYLELTERCRGLDSQYLREEMNFFRSMGIKIALDDFGTGTASLALLTELPIDELKIDMTFVRGIQRKPINQTLVKHMVQCANGIGVKTCIEGVEDENLRGFLDKYQATFYQGYCYSRPVRIEEFEKLLFQMGMIPVDAEKNGKLT